MITYISPKVLMRANLIFIGKCNKTIFVLDGLKVKGERRKDVFKTT